MTSCDHVKHFATSQILPAFEPWKPGWCLVPLWKVNTSQRSLCCWTMANCPPFWALLERIARRPWKTAWSFGKSRRNARTTWSCFSSKGGKWNWKIRLGQWSLVWVWDLCTYACVLLEGVVCMTIPCLWAVWICLVIEWHGRSKEKQINLPFSQAADHRQWNAVALPSHVVLTAPFHFMCRKWKDMVRHFITYIYI